MTYRNGPALLNSAAAPCAWEHPDEPWFCGKPKGHVGPHGYSSAPRVGGTIEDETGWWLITDIDEGYAYLLGREGVERQVAIRNLGHVNYEENT